MFRRFQGRDDVIVDLAPGNFLSYPPLRNNHVNLKPVSVARWMTYLSNDEWQVRGGKWRGSKGYAKQIKRTSSFTRYHREECVKCQNGKFIVY